MSGLINSPGSKSGIVGDAPLDDEIVGLTDTQTLTNKTITNPSGMDKNDVGLGNVDNVADASQTSTGALGSGSITSGFGTINNGSSTITTTGALAAASLNTGQGAYELYAMNQNVQTTDTIRMESLNQYETHGNAALGQGAWGTLWDTNAWTKGQYYWESSQGESYPWSVGWITKGQLGFVGFSKHISGTYTGHRFSGNSFQVYHGVSWGGTMNFTGRWRKILRLT